MHDCNPPSEFHQREDSVVNGNPNKPWNGTTWKSYAKQRINNENIIGVSPNPFIVGEDSEIIFSNIPSDAVVKLISLNGSILKTFDMKDFNRNVKWNGKSDNGRKIPSGIYLLSSYDRNLGSKTTKLAIINK